MTWVAASQLLDSRGKASAAVVIAPARNHGGAAAQVGQMSTASARAAVVQAKGIAAAHRRLRCTAPALVVRRWPPSAPFCALSSAGMPRALP